MQPSLIHLIQQRIRNQWQSKALSDYQGDTFTYAEVAHAISYCHNLFRQYGLERGDRVALCGEGCARWAIAFMAVTTYGAVPVPILTTFTPAQIQNHRQSPGSGVAEVQARGHQLHARVVA